MALVRSSPTIDDIRNNINGIYIWCIRNPEGVYRIHYIGEAANVVDRLRGHRNGQLTANYIGFCLDGLKRNIKILMHRAR